MAMKQLDLRQKKILIGVCMLAVTGNAAAWGCPAVIDSIWQVAVQSATVALTNGVNGMVTAINQQNTLNEQRIMSALKVQTKQISVNADRESANTRQVMQAVSSAMIAQDTALRAQKVMEDFGATTGQGYDACTELVKSSAVASGYGAATNVSAMVGGIDAAPGVYKDKSQTLAKRVNEHKQYFCTPSEKEAGLCSTVGVAAGESLQFSTLFKESNSSDVTSRAKDAFINNVFGLSSQPIDPAKAKTPEATAAQRDKMRMDGYKSVAMTSLKTIQAMNQSQSDTPPLGNGSYGNVGFFSSLKDKVDQYAGGKDYARWEQSLAVQSERGLLINLAKMAATKLYVSSVEYDQYERMEANLSVLLAMENQRRAK